MALRATWSQRYGSHKQTHCLILSSAFLPSNSFTSPLREKRMQFIISRTVIIAIIWQVDYVSDVHRALEWLWGRASNQRTFCLFTWTHLAALSIYFLRVLAGVSVGAVNFLTLLFGDITGTQHTLHNAKCPEVRVPGFTVRIGLSIGNTHWKITQYWKLKVRELKWALVLRTQALNPLRHHASLGLYMAASSK